MTEFKLKKTKIEEKVVDTYKKIENGVVNGSRLLKMLLSVLTKRLKTNS